MAEINMTEINTAKIDAALEVINNISNSLSVIQETTYNIIPTIKQAFDVSVVQNMNRNLYHFADKMLNIEHVVLNVNGELEKMEDQTKQIASAGNEMEDMFDQIGKVAEDFGITDAIKETAEESIKYASELADIQHVVDAVFGKNSSIDAWTQNMVQKIGVSELAAKKYAGEMGIMFRTAGIAQEDAESMSMEITELAVDLAAFANLDVGEVLNQLKSGISGENDLKEFGVMNMNEAGIEGYALSQGVQIDLSQLSQAEQIMWRYNYVLAATESLQGECARTENAYSTQLQRLHANWSTFTGEIASNVLPILSFGLSILNTGLTALSNNWSVIGPIVAGVVGIMFACFAATKGYAIMQGILNGALKAFQVVQTFASIGWGMLTGSTEAATRAQNTYSNSLLKCKLTWIIIAIIALIAILVALANWIAKTTGITQTGFGIIAGVVGVAAAAIVNILIGLANFIITMFVNLANVTSNFTAGLQLLFVNPLAGIKVMFLSLFDFIVGIVEGAASILDTVFGSSLAEDVAGFRNGIQAEIDTTLEANGIESEIFNAADIRLDGLDYGETWDKASAWGDEVANNWGNIGNTAFNPENFGAPGSIPEDIAATADNTASLNDSVDISNENLKYLKDVAERDAINRFTTAQIKVNMNNNNNISNGMDLDGVINYLTAGVTEAMGQAAEGVHA